MKQKTVFLMLMVFASFAFAQAQQPTQSAPATSKPLAETLEWLVGNWEGEGLMSGNQEFLGSMKATSELDNEAIVIMRESMNKSGGMAGGRKEIMVITYEGTTKKILLTVHGSDNTTNIFTGDLKDHEITFTLAIPAPQEGYVNKRTFKQLADGKVSFITERGSPGKPVGKLVEINFKKKA